jgi:hypothetical protein
MLTHADAATSTQPMAYDSNIHGQSCERLTFQVMDLKPVMFRTGLLKVLLLSLMSKLNVA